ncbi:ABC transporter ATP-binding protein [Xinfangfangia pollutisoli]|uniref:ABC transporter ATP-binding protein n=1 Tax=Xinfangfangia pollutisoli TaxID=2865960 RepID=UPI001CD69A65|nr:ABC transporter ATP-binding protein [Xinfangfangia pollutisoli]
MAEIVIQNLRKEFGAFIAVQGSSFTIGDGEFFMLLGPSGCGKTTTLRMIAGLEIPTSGQILIDGQDVSRLPASQRDIAMVFQMFALYPHLNVRKNIAYPLVSQGVPRAEVARRVAEVARILQIEHLMDKGVGGLSGGDRQRVALGRAIVRRPKAFMMDEPLGALDAEFRETMAEELRALHDRMGATTVYVTHDQLEAMQMGDKIVVMNHGVVEQFGTPQDIYDHPATLFVADFIGSPAMNFLPFEGGFAPGDVSVTLGGAQIAVPRLHEATEGRKLVLGVRPEHVTLGETGALRGRVLASEYLGTSQIITVETAHGPIKARAPSGQPARLGEPLALSFAGPRLTLFDQSTGRAFLTDANAGVHHG